MRIVIKVGGSLCFDESGPLYEYFSKLIPVLKNIKKDHQLIVSIGGGKQNRKFYESVAKFNLTDEEKEWIAIDMLHANARLLAYLIGTKPIFTLEEISENSEGTISGIIPGRSTDANAAIAASKIKADYFIKLTNVDGIYDKDPNKFKNAKRLEKVPFNELKNYSTSGKPGSYGILDKLAMEAIVKNKIKTVVMSGEDPKNLLSLLKGKQIGTLVS